MIQLHPQALLFETPAGESIPCSAEEVTVELGGLMADLLDPQLVRHAACAVLHYLKVELGRTQITMGEFAAALARVLRGFGVDIQQAEVPTPGNPLPETDLNRLAAEAGRGFELLFFARLRAELQGRLAVSPSVLRFTGLRGCVKQLAGARRWSNRCQALSDQIVDYLRECLKTDSARRSCALVVR
jgi:hypothetical protein